MSNEQYTLLDGIKYTWLIIEENATDFSKGASSYICHGLLWDTNGIWIILNYVQPSWHLFPLFESMSKNSLCGGSYVHIFQVQHRQFALVMLTSFSINSRIEVL